MPPHSLEGAPEVDDSCDSGEKKRDEKSSKGIPVKLRYHLYYSANENQLFSVFFLAQSVLVCLPEQ